MLFKYQVALAGGSEDGCADGVSAGTESTARSITRMDDRSARSTLTGSFTPLTSKASSTVPADTSTHSPATLKTLYFPIITGGCLCGICSSSKGFAAAMIKNPYFLLHLRIQVSHNCNIRAVGFVLPPARTVIQK